MLAYRGAAFFIGAHVVRTPHHVGPGNGDQAIPAGESGAQSLAAQPSSTARIRTQRLVRHGDGGEHVGAGVERTVRVAALLLRAHTAAALHKLSVLDRDGSV